MGVIDLNKSKEYFSRAYVNAVAAAARCSTMVPPDDLESVDLILRRPGSAGSVFHSPQLNVQTKCTETITIGPESTSLPFELPRKNYDDLRDPGTHVPIILVVMVVPEGIDNWLRHSEEQLLVFKCAYWVSLRGFPETSNTYSKTIDIPRNQQFNVPALNSIMDLISDGDRP